MPTKPHLFSFLMYLWLMAVWGCQTSTSEETTDKLPMNVLFIAVDDLRPELNCYGNEYIHSPNIDRLAQQGVLFEQAYCQQAVCSPSRTSLMTGLRPDSSHVYDLSTHFRDVVPGSITTIPQHFKQQGYHSEFWGKIFHAFLLDSASWSIEGDNQDRRIEPQWPQENWRAYVTEESNALADQNDGGGPPYERAAVPDNAYPDGVIAEKTIQTLNTLSQQDQPFFLGVGFYKPHLPFNAPSKYWDLYDADEITLPRQITPPDEAPSVALTEWGELRAYSLIPAQGEVSDSMARNLIHGYRACVSYTDAQIGKVLDELDRLNLRDNTIVVLWGDHGWKLGEYGDWCKHTNFELDTQSPLIVSVPGMATAGQKTKALVELVDIYPSLCELAGLPLPDHLQGSSFVPVLNNPDQAWKKAALSQYPRQGGAVMGYSMRTAHYRYTRWQDSAGAVVGQELYDHTEDPVAHQNLVQQAEFADTVRKLDALLTQQWKQSLVPNKPPMP
ncbi:MAG: sulfatase [Cyclobacteriaceae bacterium]